MKFDMGSSTLSALTNKTQGSEDELRSLIKQLIVAAQPLEGRFNGAARAALDRFKDNADEIANDLDRSLVAILGGQQGMNTAFVEAETTMVEDTKAAQGQAGGGSGTYGVLPTIKYPGEPRWPT